MQRRIVGQQQVLEEVMMCLLAGGHALLVGVPGLAKTLLVRTLSEALELEFRRVQFTPDLMPGDITGTEVFEEDRTTGRRAARFIRGPIFTQVLLADEINRTPPKTQAALLEAMQEGRVTAGGEDLLLPRPFFVLATQNPVEQEGTYPLPEAQLDRFMFDIPVTYPSRSEEAQIVKATTGNQSFDLHPVIKMQELIELQTLVRGVPVANDVVNYAVDLTAASRPDGAVAPSGVHRYIRYGASPWATQCLVLGGRARALLMGRYHVDFEDIRAVAPPVLRHRLALNFQARTENVTVDQVIAELIKSVPVK